MSLKLRRKKESTIPPMEAGVYFAVCVGIIDIGHQYSEKYRKSSPKVILIFEIPSERIEIDGESRPRWISGTYTNSLSKKAKLAEALVAWRGQNFTDIELESFDLSTMIGRPATVQVVQNESGGAVYANIAGITGLPKGVPVPQAENEFLVYDIDLPDEAVFEKLPEWIKDRIRASDEYSDSHTAEEEIDIDMDTGEVRMDAESGEAPF